MTSITDVYNQLVQANSSLSQIISNLTAINNTLDSEFKNVEQELTGLATLESQANDILTHISQQEDTVICALEKISKNACELVNQATRQTQLQTQMESSLSALREMYVSTHPEAALELSRREALQAEIEKCCPPPAAQQPCTYEPCAAPPPLNPQTHGAGNA